MSKKSRLQKLFEKIANDDVKTIISNVVEIEERHRSSSKENFPRQQVRDAIDEVARQMELNDQR